MEHADGTNVFLSLWDKHATMPWRDELFVLMGGSLFTITSSLTLRAHFPFPKYRIFFALCFSIYSPSIHLSQYPPPNIHFLPARTCSPPSFSHHPQLHTNTFFPRFSSLPYPLPNYNTLHPLHWDLKMRTAFFYVLLLLTCMDKRSSENGRARLHLCEFFLQPLEVCLLPNWEDNL